MIKKREFWIGEIYHVSSELLIYNTNFTDDILSTEWKESELENDDLKNYKAKAEFYIRQHQDNSAIAKQYQIVERRKTKPTKTVRGSQRRVQKLLK